MTYEYKPPVHPCTNCAEINEDCNRAYWSCHNYYGVTGYFCPACYELISHDAYGIPRHLVEQKEIKERLGKV